jgi:hypothetical protein
MFEGQPSAGAAPLQLRLAPTPEQSTPFTVRLFLTAEEDFTDNVDQTKHNRKSEFRTRLAPGVSVRADRPLGNFSLAYAPEFFFPRNSIGELAVNQNLTGRAALFPTGRFQLTLADDFTDSRDFRDVRDPGSRRTGSTNSFIQNVASAEVAYVLPRLRTALAYTNIVNQEDLGYTDTRIAHIVRPSMLYTNPRFSVGGALGAIRGDENTSASIPYWRYEVDGRFQHVITPDVRAGLNGSYQFQEPDSGPRSQVGRGRANGSFGFGPAGTLEAEAGADVFARDGQSTEVSPSFSFRYTHRFAAFAVTARYEQGYRNRSEELDATGFTLTRSGGILFTSSFLRDLTGTFGVRYEENEFQETTVLGAPSGTTDRTWSIDLDIRYMIVRSLFLTAGYTGTFRTSTQESAEFYENRVRLGLTFQYDLFVNF